MSSLQKVEWPDWRGETTIIIATGPSAKVSPLIDAKGFARIIAIKASWQLAPWADVLYGCDKDWWIENRGCPRFAGLKISPSPSLCKVYQDIKQVTLARGRTAILTGEPGRLGCGSRFGGGHSGFHAINLAVQFGAKRIILVGFDMTLRRGWHWHVDRRPSTVPDLKQMRERAAAMDACASEFDALGIEVLNASPISALTAYKKLELMEAIRWA